MAKKNSEEVKVFFMDPNSKAFKDKFAKAREKSNIDRSSMYRGSKIPLASFL